MERKLAVIFCADAPGYSQLMGRIKGDDPYFIGLFQISNKPYRTHRGPLVNPADDSVLPSSIVWSGTMICAVNILIGFEYVAKVTRSPQIAFNR